MLFVVFALANASEGATVRKGPYLIYPGTNTEMMVLWQLDGPQSCFLEWGLDTSYSDGNTVTTEYGTDHQHKHTIANLVPGSKYYYRLTVDPNQYTGSFRAAPPDDANSVKFLAYGDTRANASIFDHDMVDEAIVDAFEQDPNYQTFTMLTGDWVDDGEEEGDWDNEFFNRSCANSLELQANLPINGCIGNHEWDDDSTPPTFFDKYWPYPYVDGFYWSFDYGPAHITIIDQYEKAYNRGSAQYYWLRNDLATTNKLWKILQFHEPGYSAGHHGDNYDVQGYIQPLCEQYKVDIVFCGHNHYYARCDKNGVKHITTGGGGAPLHYDGSVNYSEYVEVCVTAHHFCKIDIRGDELTFQAVKPDATIIDEFVLIRPPLEAWQPDPADGAVNQKVGVTLSWYAGDCIGKKGHAVFFGDTYEGVETATMPTSEEFRCIRPPDSPQTFDPGYHPTHGPPLVLELWKTYYWRIDELNYGGPCGNIPDTKGDVWSFTTGCELINGDLNLDCVVNFKDFAMMADDWREQVFFPDDVTP